MPAGRVLTRLSQFRGVSLASGLVARVSRSLLLYCMLEEGHSRGRLVSEMILKQLHRRGSQLCTARSKENLDPSNCHKILVMLTGLLLNGGHGGGQARLQLLVPSLLGPSNLGLLPFYLPPSAFLICFPPQARFLSSIIFSTCSRRTRSNSVSWQILVRKVCNMSSLSLLFVSSSGHTAFSPVQRKDNLDRMAEE